MIRQLASSNLCVHCGIEPSHPCILILLFQSIIVKLNLKQVGEEGGSKLSVIGEITSKGHGLAVTTMTNPANKSSSLNLDASPVTMMRTAIQDGQPPKTVL